MTQDICTTQIAIAGSDGTVPDRIHLIPLGRTKARDGRIFVVDDPQAVIANTLAASPSDLPIDFEHQNDSKEARENGPIPAAGWIKSFEVDEKGIWAKVEWTERARAMIAAREYRYISPSMYVNTKNQNVHAFKGAGLVHTPALNLVALASAEDDAQFETATARFAFALGLNADAGEDEVLEAIAARYEPDPAEFVPIAALHDLRVETAAQREKQIADKVSVAIKEGYITPAMKVWALDLCRSDPASFETFLSSQPPAWGHIAKSRYDDLSLVQATSRETDMESHMCRQLGLAPGSLSD